MLALAACLPAANAQPASFDVPGAPFPIRVLVQSPAQTNTDLQAICLFRSSPENVLHGSLAETNDKLKGLLDRLRKPEMFRGELGETLVISPPHGSLGAKKLLIIGLGDPQTFSPSRMQLVGEILYCEASRLAVTHPFFAPTILDGGVAGFTTGQVSEQVLAGFLRAAATEDLLRNAHASAAPRVAALTFLAGPKYADSTRQGIVKAIAAAGSR
jgi:hypothetical protein